MIKRIAIGIMIAVFVLSACTTYENASSTEPSSHLQADLSETESRPEESESIQDAQQSVPVPEPIPELSFVQGLALERAEALSVNAADGEKAIREIYLYLIRNIFFADPVGLDAWRYLSDEPNVPISYIENRALSPLLFQIGSCEDFAAAMVMLLRAVGFPAEYVAGYTASIQGDYIDHAWAIVNLDGAWYHIDPQLEQNIIRDFAVHYRYYLKSDEDMLADHRWGENLISFLDMTEEEKQNIRNLYMVPSCHTSYPAPPPEPIVLPRVPDADTVNARIQQIKDENAKDTLQDITLNVEPPILTAAHHVTPPLLGDE